ncbi:YfcE family phosphodiesterase [Candidatus Nomurabacteria bacterium]|nr:YfcE family phosphodiesterase [Candidatus Nomurabacteria bacterium]
MSKLAVISDIHDNIPNLNKALALIKKEKIDYLICTGDVQSLEAWLLLDELKIPSWAVFGNVDHDILGFENLQKQLKNIKLFANVGTAEIENKKIIFTHYPTTLKKIFAKSKIKYDLALHGHTHQPWEQIWEKTKILNSGNVANIRCAPTFAIIEMSTLKARLILLNEIK